MKQEIRFCTSADGTQLAYAAYCDGEGLPVVRVGAWFVTQESNWAELGFRSITEGLASGRCIYSYDRRGIGASQRDAEDVSLEAQVQDLAAVVDHAGLERFHIAGWLDGAAVCIAYAAQHSERISRMALQLPRSRGEETWPPETIRSIVEMTKTHWSLAQRTLADLYLRDGSAEQRRALKDALGKGVSADVAAKYLAFISSFDISEFLPRVKAPTLVIAERTQGSTSFNAVRALAVQIPNVRLVAKEVQSRDSRHKTTAQLMNEFLQEGRQSAGGDPQAPSSTAVILFLDIADSTALTSKLGDAAYRAKERELDASLRSAITDAGGTPVEGKVLGDGIMSVFTSARQAIEAAQHCRDLGNEAGLPLHLGIHAGDVVREGNNVHGGAVQVAARVQSVAEPGEILVSATVRDLARTSAGVQFEDRGEHELKGIPEPQRLFAVLDGD